MSTLEICAVVVAASAAMIAVMTAVAWVWCLHMRHQVEDVCSRTRRTLRRLNRIAIGMEDLVREARRIETRVGHTFDLLLEHLEPPLRLVSALLAGTRSGLAALVRVRDNGSGRAHGRGNQEQAEGGIHERRTQK